MRSIENMKAQKEREKKMEQLKTYRTTPLERKSTKELMIEFAQALKTVNKAFNTLAYRLETALKETGIEEIEINKNSRDMSWSDSEGNESHFGSWMRGDTNFYRYVGDELIETFSFNVITDNPEEIIKKILGDAR